LTRKHLFRLFFFSSRRKKRKKPQVAPAALTVEVMLDGLQGVALTDLGSQADVRSSVFALRNGLELYHLTAPIHIELGAKGKTARSALYTDIACSVPVRFSSF
jgi:hypothetical protein